LNVVKSSLIWRHCPGSFSFPFRPFFTLATHNQG
jgi:hypothetical protein